MNLQFGLDIETNLLKYFDSQKSGILSLLDKDDLTEVIKVLINDSNDIIYRVTEFSLIGLVIHLTVAISRIRNGEEIVLDKNLLKDIKEEHMYYDAKIIASSIENKFKIKFPEDEIGYILMHLRGLRPRSVSSKIEEGLDLGNYEAMILVDRLVERFSELTDYNFNNDELLIIGLLAHLVPSLNRLRNNLEIRNPLLNEIRSEYAELFLIVKETSKLINEQEKIEISDDEIAYLTLHFGAAIERLKFNNTEARLNLGVVCASGIGISSLLSSTIKSNFPDIKNVIPLSVEEVLNDDLKERGIDLLVATLDIKSDLPTVFVNPLLREEDLNVIRKAMDGIKFTSRKDITNNLKIEKKIIDEIILLEVDLSQAFDSVLNSLIKPITEDDELTEFIKEKVKEREDVAPVIIKEKRFVLYHSSISDLNKPYVVFFRASNDRRTLLYNSIDIGALMLLPKPSNAQERYTLSNISKSLIEVEDLTDAIKHGTLKEIKEVLIESMEEEI